MRFSYCESDCHHICFSTLTPTISPSLNPQCRTLSNHNTVSVMFASEKVRWSMCLLMCPDRENVCSHTNRATRPVGKTKLVTLEDLHLNAKSPLLGVTSFLTRRKRRQVLWVHGVAFISHSCMDATSLPCQYSHPHQTTRCVVRILSTALRLSEKQGSVQDAEFAETKTNQVLAPVSQSMPTSR